MGREFEASPKWYEIYEVNADEPEGEVLISFQVLSPKP